MEYLNKYAIRYQLRNNFYQRDEHIFFNPEELLEEPAGTGEALPSLIHNFHMGEAENGESALK